MHISRPPLSTPVLLLIFGLAFPASAFENEPATSGTLVAVGDDGAVEDLPLRHTNVSIEVTAFVARTTVEQVFLNPFERPIEVVYTFPLGHRAAIDAFEMQSGDRVTRGEVRRRAEARETYEAAKSRGQQAALLEQERPNVFTQSVANLLPAGEVCVRLRTVEVLEYDAGTYRLTFPLVVGPRYIPGELLEAPSAPAQSMEGAPSDARRLNPPTLPGGLRSRHDVDILVTLDAGVPLRGLSSVSHAVEVVQDASGRARVTLSPADRIPNKDFILRWNVAAEEPAGGVLTHRDGVDGYFAFILQPRGLVDNEQAAPKEILFVLDTSGSMSGLPLQMSKAFVHDALRSLGSRDTFNLIQFASRSSVFSKVSLDRTEENLRHAFSWLDGLREGGGTEMFQGLERAIRHDRTDRYRMIVFLTDGFIGNEDRILARVKELPGDVRVFTIGVGSSVNHSLLDGMAALGGGAYTFIPNDGDAPSALGRLRGWITRPYLTDLEIDWGALPVGDWMPEIPRDLFSGQNLTVVGRYYGSGEGKVVFRGRLGGSYWEQELRVALPEVERRHGGLASAWARRRMQLLLDRSPGDVDPRDREEVIALALEHQLMSPFTSFVAVDYRVTNPGGESETILQPVPLPDGTSFEALGSSGILVQVTDPQGRPLPGARVTIRQEGGAAVETTALTDASGAVDLSALAPGSGYTVQASFPGFNTIRAEGLRVDAGVGRVLGIRMIEEFTERVTVTAARDVIDLERTAATTRFSDSFIADLPLPGRFYQNVLAMTPGVQDADGDGRPNVHGSRAQDFRSVVGGVSNVAPLTTQWISRINADSIAEMQVITAGAGVEFGRAQGGFANIVQKQGSNAHEGSFRVEAGSDALDAVGPRTIPASYDDLRGGLRLSGPFVRDRLWYHASHAWIDRSDPVRAGETLVVVPQQSASHSDMLTWQVSPRNKLAFHGQWQLEDAERFGVSSFVRAGTTPRIERDERILSGTWTMPYSPRIYLETVLHRRDTGFQRTPARTPTPNGCLPPADPLLGSAECLDLVGGALSGTAYRSFAENRRRYGVESKATIFSRHARGLTRELKLGISVGRERYDRELIREPNLLRVPRDGAELVLARTSAGVSSNSDARARNWALFIEDRLKPKQNVTVTVGLRVDAERVEGDGFTPFDPRSELEQFALDATDLTGDERVAFAGGAFTGPVDLGGFLDGVAGRLGEDRCCVEPILGPGRSVAARAPARLKLRDLNLSPFFSVKWSPRADGRMAFTLAGRRYFDQLMPAYALIESEPATADVIVASPSGSLRPLVRPSIQLVDRRLTTPYQDEWNLGFERELFAETTLSVDLVNRTFRHQIQQVDLNHRPGDFGRCAVAGDPAQSAIVPVDDPSDPSYGLYPGGGDGTLDDCDADGLADLYVQNPLWGDVALLGNFGSGTYKGFTLALNRRQYRGWEMRASYTLSEARGTAEAFDPLIGDERTLLENRPGLQSYDQRHVFKVHATILTPWGFRFGGSMTWESGLPYSMLDQRVVYDAIPPALAGLTQGVPLPRLIYTAPERNEARNDPFLDVDVRVSKDVRVGPSVMLRWSIEVLNAVNDRSRRIYPGERAYGRSINGFDDATSRFGRRYLAGLEVVF